MARTENQEVTAEEVAGYIEKLRTRLAMMEGAAKAMKMLKVKSYKVPYKKAVETGFDNQLNLCNALYAQFRPEIPRENRPWDKWDV